MTTKQSAAEFLVDQLKKHGIDTVFGIISIHMIGIYDAIKRDGSLRLVVPRHEQGILHMADGYARATGRIGVALTSTGPGAANSMGGMLEAYTAHSRVLHITSQIPSPYLDLRRGQLHEAKAQEQMFDAVSDCVLLARTAEEVPGSIESAFDFLDKPGGGPVVLTLPVDLQEQPVSPLPSSEKVSALTTVESNFDRAAKMLDGAKNPVVLLGSGVVPSACDRTIRGQLLELVERIGAVTLLAWEARGVISEDHPQVMAWTMMPEVTETLLSDCDAALVIGSKIPAMLTGDWSLALPDNLIHVDVDERKIGLNYPAAVGIIDTAERAIPELLQRLKRSPAKENTAALKVSSATQFLRDQLSEQHPHHMRLAHSVREVLPREGIVVADSTQTTYFGFAQAVPFFEPRTFLNMTTGAIGPSLPIAMGAAVGSPDKKVVQVAGDGGYLFNLGELAALGEYQLNVVTVVVNDGGYGILRGFQALAYEERYLGVDLHTPDYVAIAQACGVPGIHVDNHEHFVEALKQALEQDGPYMIEVNFNALV